MQVPCAASPTYPSGSAPNRRLTNEDHTSISPSRRRRRQGLALRRQWLGNEGAVSPPPPPCPPLRVLYLALAKDTNAYMADTLAHGLITLLGPTSVTQHHQRDVLYTTLVLLPAPHRLHDAGWL